MGSTQFRQLDTVIDDIPVTVLHPARPRGCVLFFHGLTASRFSSLPECALFAEDGLIAVAVDNVWHGDRRHPRFDTMFSEDNPRAHANFLEAVQATAQDVPLLLDGLSGNGLLDPDQPVYTAGVSMGGFITYASVLLDSRIAAAAALVGSPVTSTDERYSAHTHPAAFSRVRLLSQVAEKDTVVPPGAARQFHMQLEQYFEDYARRFACVEYPGCGHMLPPQLWDRAIARIRDWFCVEQGTSNPSP